MRPLRSSRPQSEVRAERDRDADQQHGRGRVVSRNVDPLESAVVTVGRLLTGRAECDPARAEIGIIVRSFSAPVRALVLGRRLSPGGGRARPHREFRSRPRRINGALVSAVPPPHAGGNTTRHET
jgi:hypothetical protein